MVHSFIRQNLFDRLLVEIDTLLLGDLVKANVAKAWNNPENIKDWYPAGLNAVTINGNIYGIPHLLSVSQNRCIFPCRIGKIEDIQIVETVPVA